MKYEVIIKREVYTTASVVVRADSGVEAIAAVINMQEDEIPEDGWICTGGGQSFSVLPAEGEKDEREYLPRTISSDIQSKSGVPGSAESV